MITIYVLFCKSLMYGAYATQEQAELAAKNFNMGEDYKIRITTYFEHGLR